MLYASQGREAEAARRSADLSVELRTPEAYFAAIRTYEILGDPARPPGQLQAPRRSGCSRDAKDRGTRGR